MTDEPQQLWKGRPVIDVPMTAAQRTMAQITWLCVTLSVICTLIAMNYLPATIPTHFDVAGKPDGYGSKMIILLLPGITLGMNLLLALICRLPAYKYNYTITITRENAERQYRMSKTFISLIRLLVVLMLTFLNMFVLYSTFRGGLNPIVMFAVISIMPVAMLGAVIVYFVKAMNAE